MQTDSVIETLTKVQKYVFAFCQIWTYFIFCRFLLYTFTAFVVLQHSPQRRVKYVLQPLVSCVTVGFSARNMELNFVVVIETVFIWMDQLAGWLAETMLYTHIFGSTKLTLFRAKIFIFTHFVHLARHVAAFWRRESGLWVIVHFTKHLVLQDFCFIFLSWQHNRCKLFFYQQQLYSFYAYTSVNYLWKVLH